MAKIIIESGNTLPTEEIPMICSLPLYLSLPFFLLLSSHQSVMRKRGMDDGTWQWWHTRMMANNCADGSPSQWNIFSQPRQRISYLIWIKPSLTFKNTEVAKQEQAKPRWKDQRFRSTMTKHAALAKERRLPAPRTSERRQISDWWSWGNGTGRKERERREMLRREGEPFAGSLLDSCVGCRSRVEAKGEE